MPLRAEAGSRKECSWSPEQLESGSRVVGSTGSVAVKDRASDKAIGRQGKKFSYVSSPTFLVSCQSLPLVEANHQPESKGHQLGGAGDWGRAELRMDWRWEIFRILLEAYNSILL